MKQEYFDIPGFEGEYSISKDGRIWSYRSKSELILQLDKDGYYRILLYHNGKKHNCLLHRLLALTFIPNPENKPTVDHINHNRSDNRIENLRWATMYEQNHNQIEDNFVHYQRPVECRNKEDHSILIATFDNCCQAAVEMFGDRNKNSLINRCAQGKKKSAYGYWWKFIDN